MQSNPLLDQLFSNPKLVGLIAIVIVLAIASKFIKPARRRRQRAARPRSDDSSNEASSRRATAPQPPPLPPSAQPVVAAPPPVIAYRPETYILSRSEMSFFLALQAAIPPNTLLLCQTPLQCIISPDKRSSTWQADWNRIAAKHVDFVFCDQWTRPLAVIELDDRSHATDKRKERDTFLDAALASAGVRVVHVPAANSYDANQLRQLLVKG